MICPYRICQHWWDCPTPNGKVAVSTCIYCGETREFENSFPDGFETYHASTFIGGKIIRTPINNVDSILRAPRKNRLQKGMAISMASDFLY